MRVRPSSLASTAARLAAAYVIILILLAQSTLAASSQVGDCLDSNHTDTFTAEGPFVARNCVFAMDLEMQLASGDAYATRARREAARMPHDGKPFFWLSGVTARGTVRFQNFDHAGAGVHILIEDSRLARGLVFDGVALQRANVTLRNVDFGAGVGVAVGLSTEGAAVYFKNPSDRGMAQSWPQASDSSLCITAAGFPAGPCAGCGRMSPSPTRPWRSPANDRGRISPGFFRGPGRT